VTVAVCPASLLLWLAGHRRKGGETVSNLDAEYALNGASPEMRIAQLEQQLADANATMALRKWDQ
jgi:hypothetical protein